MYFFSKDNNYYVVPVFEPFSGFLDGNLPDIPKLEYTDTGATSREKPIFTRPDVIMEKVSEDENEIVFELGDIRHVFDKTRKIFIKVYQVNPPKHE
ncbi:MAG: hypothetical protein HGA95_00990 [Caldiserica bacterium]|nr:hypothetical protein [Caldisericota bacterium]